MLATAGSTSYSYDTSGRRLSKTTGSTTTNYYYAGDMLVGQKTGSNKIEFLYDLNGEYYGFEYNDTPYYYFKNLQGDVVAIGEDYNTIVATYEYDAWGRLISSTDTSGINIGTITPIRYRSYYYDTETGFYYLKTRYYSPEICRFLSPDVYVSTGQGVLGYNMFAYCNNNAVINIDITGTIHVKGTDACGIVSEDSFSIGFSTYYSIVDDYWNFDNLFFGYEDGFCYTISSSSNLDNDNEFFYEKSDLNNFLLDATIGMNVNIKNGGFRVSKGLVSCSIAACINSTSFEFFITPSKAGFTIAYDVDYKNLTAGYYEQIYFRPIPILCSLAIVEAFPVIATSYIANFAYGDDLLYS